MEIEQVAELARTVAWLPKAERDFLDGMVAEQSAMAAEAERIAKLRKMSDEDAVKAALVHMADAIRWREVNLPKLMRDLKGAGFARPSEAPKQGEIRIVFTMSDESTVRLRGKEEDLQRLCRDLRIGREIVSIFPETEVA